VSRCAAVKKPERVTGEEEMAAQMFAPEHEKAHEGEQNMSDPLKTRGQLDTLELQAVLTPALCCLW
jgi:hypothetical protein